MKLVDVISRIIAIIITVIITIGLCPIALVFYCIGFLGKIGDVMLEFVKWAMNNLWPDNSNIETTGTENITSDEVYQQ